MNNVKPELVPHPDQLRSVIAEMDYCMQGSVFWIKLRAATEGFFLCQWSVDCSPDHSLRAHEFRPWLKDHLALYSIKYAMLTPGYSEPNREEKSNG